MTIEEGEWIPQWKIGGSHRFDGRDFTTLHCTCGSGFTWYGFEWGDLEAWRDAHTPHMTEVIGNVAT